MDETFGKYTLTFGVHVVIDRVITANFLSYYTVHTRLICVLILWAILEAALRTGSVRQIVRIKVFNYQDILRLEIKMHDSFGMQLMQAEQDISGDHLNIAEVERFAPCNQILNEIGRIR